MRENWRLNAKHLLAKLSGEGCFPDLAIYYIDYIGLTYLKDPHLFLTHRTSKHASKVLTAMNTTIPATISVMSTVPSFTMVSMGAI